MTINVQFSDATETIIVATFGCPQNATAYPNQGTVLPGDARWAAYYATLPASMQAGLPPPTTPLAPTPAQTAAAAYAAFIAGGITVTSTGTPALDGIYAIDQGMQEQISEEAQFVGAFQEFTTGSATNLPWFLANNNPVIFPTTTEFMAFAKQVGQLVAAAKLAYAQAASMPAAAITIP